MARPAALVLASLVLLAACESGSQLAVTSDAVDVPEDEAESAPPSSGTACGDAPGATCGLGEVCDRLGCQVGAAGYCRALPDTCPGFSDPVCGCDGTTYVNDCLRARAGVALLHEGVCGLLGSACGDLVGVTCTSGLVCDLTTCDQPALGLCVSRPAGCPDSGAPVCGCDGVTYPSDCHRLRARVSRRQVGPCPSGPAVCGTLSSPACRAGETCDVSGCGLGAPGVCVALPTTCSAVVAPVCGCDGVTWPNDCERLRAGVRAAHPGPCGALGLPCGDGHGGDCEPPLVCDRPSCEPGAAGVCTALPRDCGAEGVPVCGCDGVSYANDCERLAAGAPRAHKGPCPSGKACGTFPDGGCPAGEVCDLSTCEPGAVGTCVPRTEPCPEGGDPVCGCDGVAYASDCERLAAGAALDHPGACSD